MVFFSFLCTKLGNYACKKPLVFAYVAEKQYLCPRKR